MNHYYNEFDQFCADWLANLVSGGMLPDGVVDARSITDLNTDDIIDYKQCHFFAGLGGWPLALKQAGWPDDREVITASVPCQGFSHAGKRKGFDDERDLWPVFFRLVKDVMPEVMFGEQVSNAVRFGWVDRCREDLERVGYEFSISDIPAAAAGAPHIRQRLYWCARRRKQRRYVTKPHGGSVGSTDRCRTVDRVQHQEEACQEPQQEEGFPSILGNCEGKEEKEEGRESSDRERIGMADTGVIGERQQGRDDASVSRGRKAGDDVGVGIIDVSDSSCIGMADADSFRREGERIHLRGRGSREAVSDAAGGSSDDDGRTEQPSSEGDGTRRMGDSIGERSERWRLSKRERTDEGVYRASTCKLDARETPRHWDRYDIIDCLDGKRRRIPTEPSLQPLAARPAKRMGRLLTFLRSLGMDEKELARMVKGGSECHTGLLKAAGNSLCVPLAVIYVKAFLMSE